MVLPFYTPIYIPYALFEASSRALIALKVLSKPPEKPSDEGIPRKKRFKRLNLPMNFITAPLLGTLLLLCVSAVGEKEVRNGTLGRDDIYPIDIMTLSLLLSYIGLSIEASGFPRYLALRTLQFTGHLGHRLFFYLYLLSFTLSVFLGNEPVVLSMTPFLISLLRIPTSPVHERAWIYSQLTVANIGASMVVSSSTTNLILVETFKIKFISYTANMAVPVSVSAAILFPFLLYVVFADERLIPTAFQIPTIHEEEGSRVPVNPILHIMGNGEVPAPGYATSEGGLNPFLDRLSAWTGTLILVATIITLLVLDATRVSNGEHTVFWVALPGAFVVFCWDTYSGWHQRHLTRAIIERVKSSSEMATNPRCVALDSSFQEPLYPTLTCGEFAYLHKISRASTEPQTLNTKTLSKAPRQLVRRFSDSEVSMHPSARLNVRKVIFPINQMHEETSLQSLASSLVKWLHVTFPTAMGVLASMPFEIIPFTLCMFVLVEALVNNGWVPVFAHGLDQWVEKTGVVGAVGGIGFLSVIIGNYLGSSVGTTILLSRVLQRWQEMRRIQGTPLSDRTFTAAVYSLAIGASFGGSTAGLLWRRELLRRNVHVDTPQYARVSFPITSVNMAVACLVLVGQVYITRSNDPGA